MSTYELLISLLVFNVSILFSQTPGTIKWSTINLGGYSSPAISSNGTIYVGSDKLCAINPNGSIKWEVQLYNNRIYTSPAIASDGTIYLGLQNG